MVYVINGEHLTRRKLITIDGSKVTTHTNIPLGLNINLPGVKADGADVRLAKLDGTPIAREIECKDVPNTDDIMIWYPWDTTLGQNDQFWIYWGNSNLTEPASDSTYGSQAVWDINYVGVWHMNNDPNGDVASSIKDSTSNANHGTPSGSMTTSDLVDGDYGKGLDFDNTNDKITFGSDYNFDEYTIELIANPDTLAGSGYDAFFSKVGSATGYELLYNAGQGQLSHVTYNAGWKDLFKTISTGTNQHIAGTFSTTNGKKIFVNGVVGTDATQTTYAKSGATLLTLAEAPYYTGRWYDGKMYEVRISDISRTDNYVITTYNNLNNPTTTGASPFYKTFGLSQHQRRTPQFMN